MKKIKLTEQDIEQARKEFEAYLTNTKFSSAKIDFSKSFTSEIAGERQVICMADYTYLKMLQYVLSTEKEIAWHGTVSRTAHGFYIKQVFLYPQTVSGATVSTDQEKYNTWCEKLDDDTINSMRFQGHSHVNMSTSPSSVDTSFYDDLLSTLGNNDYYIFLIINKKQELNFMIYDLATNIIYEKSDIDFIILDENNNSLAEALKTEIKDNIEEHTYTTLPKYNFGTQKSYDDYFDDDPYYTTPWPKYQEKKELAYTKKEKHVVILDRKEKNFEKIYPEYEGEKATLKQNGVVFKCFVPYKSFGDEDIRALRLEGWKVRKMQVPENLMD